MSEKAIRQQARSLNQVAEQMKMMRLASEGKLADYLVSKEVRKMQNRMNRQVRKAMGLK
jgi:hypothetical protein